MWIVQLEPGVWISDRAGDLLTFDKQLAYRFRTYQDAERATVAMRRTRPFPAAVIVGASPNQ